MTHDTHQQDSPGAGQKSGLVRMRTMSPMSRRRFGLTAAAAGLGMTMTTPARRASAATDISYMGWQGYDDAANVNGFLDNNDLVMEATYMESQEQWITAMQSGGRGNMDLGTPVDIYIDFAVRAGLLEPLDMSLLPNMDRVYPEFRNMDNLQVDGVPYAVPFVWGSLPIMYNADVIKEAPTSWWDLFDPKYKGKATVVEDSLGTFMIFSLMANGTKTPWFNTKEMADKTVELMIKFKKEQALTICASYGDLAALLGSGEVVIASGWEPVRSWTGEDSPDIQISYPKEGFPNFIDTYAIFADAPNVEWDHKILNHVMSADAQAGNAEINSTAVTNMDALPLLSDNVRSMYPYDDIESFFKRAGGHMQMFPLEDGTPYQTYDQLLEGWEEFLKA